MDKVVYRYEDSNGFGPFYNLHRAEFTLNNCRCGCLSYYDLINWFNSNANGAEVSSKYRLTKYIVDFPSTTPFFAQNGRIICVGNLEQSFPEVYFDLSWVREKEIVNG